MKLMSQKSLVINLFSNGAINSMNFKRLLSSTNTYLKIIICSLLLSMTFFSNAQNTDSSFESKLNSLEILHSTSPEQALSRALTLLEQHPNSKEIKVWLARIYSQFSEFEKAFNFAKQAAEQPLTESEKVYVEIATAFFYRHKHDQVNALKHFDLAVESGRLSNDPNLIVETLSIRGDALSGFNQTIHAMADMAKAYELIDQVSKPSVLASMYNTMCNVYLKNAQYDAAIESMVKAIEYVLQTNNKQQLSVAYYNLADIYTKTKQYDKALQSFKSSETYSITSGDEIGIAFAQMGLGHSYLLSNNPELALPSLLSAELVFLKENHISSLIRIYSDLAKTYTQLGEFKNAQHSLDTLNKYTSYQTESNQHTFTQAKETLAELYFAQKQYTKAFEQQKVYIQALNELHDIELKLADKSAFEKLNNTITAKENEVLRLENTLNETELDKQKKQSKYLLVIVIFLLFITTVVSILLKKNRKLRKKLNILATTDDLTQLYNRRKIMSLLSSQFAKYKTNDKALYVAIFDLDNFKKINDVYGHVMGDQVLQLVAQCAKKELGTQQKIGRYGGEEFLVILDIDGYKEAYAKLDQFRAAVSKLTLPNLDSQITISIGLSEASEQDNYQTDIIQRADKALYKAKKAGRNQLLGL
mgnify:CR=1 FL=1